MKQNRSVVIWTTIAIFVLITAIGFLLVSGRWRNASDDSVTQTINPQNVGSKKVDQAADLFSDFKAEEETLLNRHFKDVSDGEFDSQTSSKKSQAFCWNGENKTFEKVNSDVVEGNPVFSLDKFSKTQSADLDGNAIEEKYDLQDGKLTVMENEKVIWQSAADWWVENFVLADSTNDGIVDINLSLWKSGSFGRSKPFWIKQDDPSIKNHLFIFDWKDGKMQSVWQSSNLDAPNCQILVDDMNNDGQNELIVVEGDYADAPDCQGKYMAVWKWGEWGFGNEWRSEEGEIEWLGITKVGGKKYFVGF